MAGIPQVRLWMVRVLDQGVEITRCWVWAPTRKLAKLNFRHEYPGYWGKGIKVSPIRSSDDPDRYL